MSYLPGVDPLSDGLSGLPSIAPRQAVSLRVRQRCHAELNARRRRNAAGPQRVADGLVAAAVAAYLVVVVSEAVRLLEAIAG